MEKIINEIKINKIGKILRNVYMRDFTTYKVGGKVSLMVFPFNEEKLIKLLNLIKQFNLSYKVVGGGSNLIFSDCDYEGIIIKLDYFNHLLINDNVITVGSGYNLMKLALSVSRLGLTGLEFATGIPGTVGGAVYMNSGAYKKDMGDVISQVKVLTGDARIINLTNKEMAFGYRSSILQAHPDYICLEATLVLSVGDKKEIKELILDRKTRRLMSQPLNYPSAGSVFRNPPDDFAGRLIEECGLKGRRIGGALVSTKHANFIINDQQATAADIRHLILLVKRKVKEKYAVDLKVEQEFVNWE